MPNTIQILPLGAPAPEAIYRAFSLQPGAETLLAEGIGNEKGECKLEYQWNGGKALHVQVRAFPAGSSPPLVQVSRLEPITSRSLTCKGHM